MPTPLSSPNNTPDPQDDLRDIDTHVDRDEAVSLEKAATLNTRPFEKLRNVGAAMEHDREAWEKSEALINESDVLSRVKLEDQKRLKHAFQEALTKETHATEADPSQPPSSAINTPEADAYLTKTASLIAHKLADIINGDGFTEKVYKLGEVEAQKRVMAKHMMSLVDENQALRKEVHLLRKELSRYTPAALGLYQKK